MPTYQLQIKQIVDYPRCRIYRQFVRFLMEDRSIRVSGGSGLFYFTVLCSYANFRTSYRRIDGISYTVYPGHQLYRLPWRVGLHPQGAVPMVPHPIPVPGAGRTGTAAEAEPYFLSGPGPRKCGSL